MIPDELSEYYFQKALKAAMCSDLSKAVMYAAISTGINQNNDDCFRLAGLCYYKLGNYVMADYCLNHSSFYTEQIKDMLLKKQERINEVKKQIDKLQYKKAIQLLEKEDDKSINEYHYLGCLYAVVKNKKKAVLFFLEALKEDHSNKNSLCYLKEIQYIKEKRWWHI